jgi:hypothetical protein
MDERSFVSSDDCIVFRLVGRRKDARSLKTNEEGGLFSGAESSAEIEEASETETTKEPRKKRFLPLVW